MSTAVIYELGELVTLTVEFFSDEALTMHADPTTVVLSIRDPDRVITTPTPTSTVPGVYTYAWIPAKPGLHEVNWTGTGAIVAAQQEAIFVKVGIALGANLCSLEAVRLFLKKQPSDTADDSNLELLITSASAVIEQYTSREFTPLGELTRRFRVTPSRNPDNLATVDFGNLATVELGRYDLQSITSITLGPTETVPTLLDPSVYALPAEPDILGVYSQVLIARQQQIWGVETWRDFGYALVDITGIWGAAAIPADVAQACISTVAEWYRGKVAAFSTTFNADSGTFEKPEPLPAAVCGWLDAYRRYVV